MSPRLALSPIRLAVAGLAVALGISASAQDTPNPTDTLPPGVTTRMLTTPRSGPSLQPADPPTDARVPARGNTLFVPIAPEHTGLTAPEVENPNHPLAFFYGSGMEAGGVAVGDVDGDGLPDLFVASSPGNNRLYRQVGRFQFEDITPGSGLDADDSWSRGCSLVDVDRDGDLDLFVANYDRPNALYLNQGHHGDGRVTFVDNAQAAGVALIDSSLMPSFCDYDRDGHLDFYLVTNQYHMPPGAQVPDISQLIINQGGKPVIKPPFDRFLRVTKFQKNAQGGMDVKWDAKVGRPDVLYRNNGDGTFTDVTTSAGILSDRSRGLSATWWDYDEDGLSDLYVANDWGERDYLYRNRGDGTFEDAIEEAVPYTPMFSMGSDTGDLNNDGRIDFMCADMAGTTHYKRKISMGSMEADQFDFLASARPQQTMRNVAYLNTGTGHLLEAAYQMRVANSDWSWAIKIVDLDNDGRSDLFVTNGMEKNVRENEGTIGDATREELLNEKNIAFRNLGDLHFEPAGEGWGLDHYGFSLATASCDFDRDGDLDLCVINRNEAPMLYENRSSARGVLVQLQGRTSNLNGIGAKLRIETAAGIQSRQVTSTRGYLSSEEALVHFGLGTAPRIDRLVIDWPSGHQQELTNLAAGQLIHLIEPEGKPVPPSKAPPQPLFVELPLPAALRHTERPFDDFAAQPLLPNKLSQLGPGLAVGDLNGDGSDDLVLGGAAGSPTLISLHRDGKPGNPSPLAGSEAYEDMGILLLDVDADKDLDLFAVSGGVESSGAALRDRLYLNDGKGKFSPAPADALPDYETSGGAVAAADIDHDGDLDLFVGGRVIPGEYPRAVDSHLLLNDGGRFKLAPERAPMLASFGLVTGATFADLDGDGWQDLLVTREWGPIAYLQNKDGKFVDKTAEAGLDRYSGWWNGIAAGDVDGDGDLDFVATNFGHNTKYHASEAHPALLYYGKFGTDKMRLVEAEFEGEQLFPVRGKSCSTQAIPHLANKFKSFHSFALADLKEVYTKPTLDEATKFSATTLGSGVFLNGGKDGFTFRELPALAQIAPGFGVSLTDFDADGNLDAFLAQNFYGPQIETGRMSGGLGCYLRGNGDGSFEALWPLESGIAMPEDATAVATPDLDGDSRPDLLVASNNGPLRAFLNRAPQATPGAPRKQAP